MADILNCRGRSADKEGRRIAFSLGGSDAFGVETISADSGIGPLTASILAVSASGAARALTFSADVEAHGAAQLVYNAGSTYNVVLKNSAGSTIITLAPGELVAVVYDASAWAVLWKVTASAVLTALATYGLDRQVSATIAVADSATNDAALTLQLNRLDGSTPVAAARQVMIMTSTSQYAPAGQPEASVTFGTATTGSIIASGQGWCLAETSAAGAFACTATNTDNETIYFFTQTAARVSDPSKGCGVVASNTDAATWS